MINNKVSVIVPVYNVGNYLHKCLNSILNQTYDNIEVILIEDCSEDNSIEICRQYAAADERIVLLQNDINHGFSYSRNRALKIVSGGYVTMIDSDDWIEPNTVELMISAIKKYSTDVCICGYIKEFDSGIEEKNEIVKKTTSISNHEVLNHTMRETAPYVGFTWGKLYKTDVIRNNGLYYDESISICEDSLFNYQFFDLISDCVLLGECLYHYRIRKTSATRTASADKIRTKLAAFEKGALIAQKYADSPFFYKVYGTVFNTAIQYSIIAHTQGNGISTKENKEILHIAQNALHKTGMKNVSKKLLVKYLIYKIRAIL